MTSSFQTVLPNLSGESGCRLAWVVDGAEKVIYLHKAEFDKLDDILSNNTDGKIDLEDENCYIKIDSKSTQVFIDGEKPLLVDNNTLKGKIAEFVAKI